MTITQVFAYEKGKGAKSVPPLWTIEVKKTQYQNVSEFYIFYKRLLGLCG